MDKKIIQLAEENKLDELITTLAEVENAELCQMIQRKVLKGRNDTFTLVRAILLGSPTDSRDSIVRRCDVYKQCIASLQKNDMNNKMAAELVSLLMLEADTLPGPTLAELAAVYVDGIKSQGSQTGMSLELLPKLLSAIAAQENIVYGGNHMKGLEYKNHVLNQLCSCRWDPGQVIHLAAMFRDVPLTNDELRFVIEKVVRMFKELDLENIPAVIYQLLLLATKGHKKLVLDGVIQFFTDLDRKQKPHSEMECSEDLLDDGIDTSETLRHTEGTVILHISFAVKQHQDLGREFVKCLKTQQQCSPTKMLSPFSLALSLSLARIHRFEEQIFDVLKAAVLKSFKDRDKQDQSHWVQELVSESASIEEFVFETIHNSKYGWDHVVQGLVQLGFILMDSFGPRGAFGRTDVVPSMQSGPTHSACKLGSTMLIRTFKAHEMVRSEILEQIFNRVVTKATSPVVHYLDLLSDIVYTSPQMLLDSMTKVREMFDYLAYLAPSSAEGLLRAIQPLLKLSMGLKDNLIVVLRKAMFSRQLDARKIGADGFLMLLRHFRVLGGICSSQCSQPSFSSSQIEVDIHTSYNPSSNESLCLEILGNLRRCLSQQADVRLLLYQGLVDVLDRNTQLKDPILQMLTSQLSGYYEKNTDVAPPLKLDPCIIAQGEQVYLAEPLAHLLCCVQLCLIKAADVQAQQHPDDDDDDDDDSSSRVQVDLEKLLKTLTERMLSAEMEDFELDKSADYSLASSVGVRNNIFAILILGTYEVLLEYTFMSQPLSETSGEQLLQLFECHKRLADLLREKSATAANKKGKTATSKTPHSLLSLKMVNQALEMMLSTEEGAVKELYENHDFLKYLLSVCQQKLQQIQDKGHCDGVDGKVKAKLIMYCSNMGRLLLGYYVRHQLDGGEQRVREKQILTLTLECLVAIVTLISQQFSIELEPFLETLDRDCTEDSSRKDDKIYFHIKKFQRLVINLFNMEEENRSMKDVGLLLGSISQLCKCLPASYSKTEHVLAWLEKICKEQSVDDLSVTKSLLSSLVTLGQRLKDVPVVLRELSQDVHSQLGDIDQEVEVDDRVSYNLVTIRSAAPTVTQIILQQCERELDDTDWVISRIKADTLAAAATQTGGESPKLTQREGHEKSMCTRLGVLIEACHELVQSVLPVGPCTEHLLKTLTRLYTSLTLLVKYYLSMYSSRLGHLTARFERLVKLSGTHLTQYCYAMITFIQTAECEKLQNAAPEKKKKKDDKKKGTQGQAAKTSVLKQTKNIPNLIYAIEQYERYLIQLTKKSKVDLMEHMKNSTSRDFRINVAVVSERLEQDSDSLPESSEGEEEEEERENTTVADSTINSTVHEESRSADSDDEEDGASDQENEAPVAKKPAAKITSVAKKQVPKAASNKLSNKKRPAAKNDKEPAKKRVKLGPAKRTVGKPSND